ncbi:MAG: amidohydrolase family protein [Thermoplasmata archaeon]
MVEIYDAHVHLGPSGQWLPYLDPAVDSHTLVGAMDKHDIDKSIIFPNPASGDRYPEFNDIIADAVKEHSSRLIGFGRVDPRRGEEAVEEVYRCMDMGLIGIKLHPFVETYRPDHPDFARLFDVIYEGDMIVLTHTGGGFASPGLMKKVLQSREEMKIILGHLNEGCISLVKNYENVYVDTSGSRVYMLNYACETIPEGIVFGSDYPYLNYRVQKTVVDAADISFSLKEMIFSSNLKKLLKG